MIDSVIFGPGLMEDDQEDEQVHTPSNPYCSNFSCWCHNNSQYHEQVIHPKATEVEVERAYTFFEVRA
jgi:hypothetical protein